MPWIRCPSPCAPLPGTCPKLPPKMRQRRSPRYLLCGSPCPANQRAPTPTAPRRQSTAQIHAMGGWLSAPLVLFVATPTVAGALVSATTVESIKYWYQTLKKPSWNPPSPVFGQVWSFMYPLIGFAAFVVWANGGFQGQATNLGLFGAHLALNLSWPGVFFNSKELGAAQAINLAALATAVLCCKRFFAVKPLAGYLFVPYVAWLTFANAINYAILKLNPDPKGGVMADLREPDNMKNPGEAGYTPKPEAGKWASNQRSPPNTSGQSGYPAGGANAAAFNPGPVGRARLRCTCQAARVAVRARVPASRTAAPLPVRLPTGGGLLAL